jgi:hypothetical protein
VLYLNERRLSGFEPIGFGFADEMPNRVFNVIRIYGLVELELFDSFGVLFRIIIGDAALPVMSFLFGDQFDYSVEVGNGFLKLAAHEASNASLLMCGGRFWAFPDLPV